MPDIIYSYGKLGEAVQALAVHRGRVKERLLQAAILLVGVDATIFDDKSMPTDAPGYWRRIHSAITSAPRDLQRGVYAPSIDKLSEEQASEIAQLIVSLESMVATALEPN